MLQLLDEGHYERLWSELSARKPLKDFLLRLFLVLRDVGQPDVFPADWRTMHSVSNQVMLRSLEHLSRPLITYFLDSGCFDSQVGPHTMRQTLFYVNKVNRYLSVSVSVSMVYEISPNCQKCDTSVLYPTLHTYLLQLLCYTLKLHMVS